VRGQEPENESRKLFFCCCDVERCFTSTSLEKTQIGFVTQSFFSRQTGRALSKLACLLASLLVFRISWALAFGLTATQVSLFSLFLERANGRCAVEKKEGRKGGWAKSKTLLNNPEPKEKKKKCQKKKTGAEDEEH
jgi:hypothetical protein